MAQKRTSNLGDRAVAEAIEEGLRGLYQAVEKGLHEVARALRDVADAQSEVAAAIRDSQLDPGAEPTPTTKTGD